VGITHPTGSELELVEATLEDKTKLNATPYPILSIYADEQEKLYMALFIGGVSIPVPVIEFYGVGNAQ
jgi:hypothetical protein